MGGAGAELLERSLLEPACWTTEDLLEMTEERHDIVFHAVTNNSFAHEALAFHVSKRPQGRATLIRGDWSEAKRSSSPLVPAAHMQPSQSRPFNWWLKSHLHFIACDSISLSAAGQRYLELLG